MTWYFIEFPLFLFLRQRDIFSCLPFLQLVILKISVTFFSCSVSLPTEDPHVPAEQSSLNSVILSNLFGTSESRIKQISKARHIREAGKVLERELASIWMMLPSHSGDCQAFSSTWLLLFQLRSVMPRKQFFFFAAYKYLNWLLWSHECSQRNLFSGE